MDFFKSVFTPDPDPESSESEEADTTTPDHDQPTIFMGFIKTLATTSESVIQTYRRDLEEFGSGFKKETEAIREAAVRAVRDLPVSLEAKAYSAIDALLDSSAPESNANAIDDDSSSSSTRSFSSNRFGRLQLQLHALHSDPNTFLQDPEDLHDFSNWKQQQTSTLLPDTEQQIGSDNSNSNSVLSVMLDNLVPDAVDYDTFWTRYLYKLHKLKQADNARAMLVKRVIAREEDEEDLSWEVDDDDDQQQPPQNKQTLQQHQVKPEDNKLPEPVKQINEDNKNKLEIESRVDEKPIEDSKPKALSEQKPVEKNSQAEVTLTDENSHAKTELQSEGNLEILDSYVKVDPAATKSSDVQVASEGGNSDNVVVAVPHKDTKISAVSTQTSVKEEEEGEEEIGWDEIEDLGDSEEKKAVVSGGSPKKTELRKKLIVAEDDEDLSWDIEDD